MSAKLNTDAADASRRKIFIIAAIASALLIALIVFWATTRSRSTSVAGQQPRLEGALRAGSPEFAQALERIVVEPNPDEATESPRPAGDIVMTLRPKVRNFTGRTISGLELLAMVVDLDNKPVRQRTKIAVPNAETGMSEFEPNKVIMVPIVMEGFRKDDVRANIRVEVTGVRFK
ncbi:MAG: hypothetical protein QOG00_3472 [Pyrinomonadaceae bacterium]|nr:hypothetical protein [Pyrinomonadaceae bacterium]MDX6271459.1 hypothetical protein [Acidobacteriota bacterium]